MSVRIVAVLLLALTMNYAFCSDSVIDPSSDSVENSLNSGQQQKLEKCDNALKNSKKFYFQMYFPGEKKNTDIAQITKDMT